MNFVTTAAVTYADDSFSKVAFNALFDSQPTVALIKAEARKKFKTQTGETLEEKVKIDGAEKEDTFTIPSRSKIEYIVKISAAQK